MSHLKKWSECNQALTVSNNLQSHMTQTFLFSICTPQLVLRRGGPNQDPTLNGVSTEDMWP